MNGRMSNLDIVRATYSGNAADNGRHLRAALAAVNHAGIPVERFNFFNRLSNGFRDRIHQKAACSNAEC